MEIITGYVGKAHVKAEQDRDINQGIIGPGSYVLKTGMQLAAEVSSNNEIKIRDGVLMHQGCAASIKKNTYDSLTIINGSQGMKRIDLIIARYEKDQNNGTESLELKVIQGTPAEANAEVPSYTEGDIQAGDYVADMPLYQVVIDGLNITEVTALFEVIGSNKDLSNKIANIPQIKAGTIIKTVEGGNNSASVFTNAEINKMFGVSDATNLNTVAIFTEGDAAARTSGGHMDGAAYLNGTWYATYAELFSGTAKVRINYTIIYFG